MRQKRCRDFATHRRNRLEREGVSGGVGSTRRGLDPRPIAVRDFSKYTISTLPAKARDAVNAALAAEAFALPMSGSGVRRAKAALSSGCKPHPAIAPAGSNRSSHRGNEVAEAFDYSFLHAQDFDRHAPL